MSDVVAVALISAIPGIFAATIGFVNNVLGRRNARHLEAQKDAIVTLEKNTNSIKDALVKVTGESEFAKGLKRGQEESKSVL